MLCISTSPADLAGAEVPVDAGVVDAVDAVVDAAVRVPMATEKTPVPVGPQRQARNRLARSASGLLSLTVDRMLASAGKASRSSRQRKR